MIARIWKGAVRRDDAAAYADHIGSTGMAEYSATPGNHGAWMLRRNDGDRSEIIAFSLEIPGRHPGIRLAMTFIKQSVDSCRRLPTATAPPHTPTLAPLHEQCSRPRSRGERVPVIGPLVTCVPTESGYRG